MDLICCPAWCLVSPGLSWRSLCIRRILSQWQHRTHPCLRMNTGWRVILFAFVDDYLHYCEQSDQRLLEWESSEYAVYWRSKRPWQPCCFSNLEHWLWHRVATVTRRIRGCQQCLKVCLFFSPWIWIDSDCLPALAKWSAVPPWSFRWLTLVSLWSSRILAGKHDSSTTRRQTDLTERFFFDCVALQCSRVYRPCKQHWSPHEHPWGLPHSQVDHESPLYEQDESRSMLVHVHLLVNGRHGTSIEMIDLCAVLEEQTDEICTIFLLASNGWKSTSNA